jgi:uncharacterized protein YuzE
MALTKLQSGDLSRILAAVPGRIHLPFRRVWADYDDEADVLYLSFRRPQRATDRELLDVGLIIHRSAKQIVGVTILEASTR